jgi:hypothetical protein
MGEQLYAFPDECKAIPVSTSLECLESAIMKGQIVSAVAAVAVVAAPSDGS